MPRRASRGAAWWARLQRTDALVALLFLAPSFAVLGVFVYFPLVYTLYLSLHRWNLIAARPTFVGAGNFQALVADRDFHLALVNTVVFSLGTVVVPLALALPLAVLLNRRIRGRTVYRTVFFVPYVTTMVAVGLLWMWMFDPSYGLVNLALRAVGLPGPAWLQSPQLALAAIIVTNIWRLLGYNVVVFLAGLQAIPRDYYEAASIDGAGPRQQFFAVTVPLISPTSFFLVVTGLIASFQVFDTVAVMTAGGPLGSTNVIVYYLYQKAFQLFEVGYASAIAVILFVIILALSACQFAVSRYWVHY